MILQRVLFKRKFPDGALTIFIKSHLKNFVEGGKNSCVGHFLRYADCQLRGGVGSQENVSLVSARGVVPKWAFLAPADMWMTPNEILEKECI